MMMFAADDCLLMVAANGWYWRLLLLVGDGVC
jgi:hypothetical protein